jgi:hypothetical protein
MPTETIPRFAIRDLSVLQFANGFTLWSYKAGDAFLSSITAPGFFNEARDILRPGDHIHVSGIRGGAVLYVVSSNDDAIRVLVMCAAPVDAGGFW